MRQHKKKIPFLFILLSQWVFADISSQPNGEQEIKGVVLVSDEKLLLSADELQTVSGLQIRCVSIPTSLPKLQTYMCPYYVNQPLNEQQIQTIKNKIRSYFVENEDPFVLIYIPQQTIKKGVLQLIVKHTALDRISVEGNKYFSDGLYKNYLGAHLGEPIDATEVSSGISFINQNPFRNAVAIYSPGAQPGTTDLTVSVKEAFLVRVYVGADNMGIPTIQRQRFFQGLNWAKAFGLDHIFSVQHTSSYNFHTFDAWTGDYQAFLPWKHMVRIYGGFSSLHTSTEPIPGLMGNNKGASGQASIRYILPFTTFSSPLIKQQFILGFDYKNTNNTIFFSALEGVFGDYANLSQFVLGYERSHLFPSIHSQFDLEIELFFSPGAMLPNESDVVYDSLRPGAVNHWLYAKAYVEYFQRLPKDFSCLFWIRAQMASENLLPSEQIGIGGYDTVRGYNQSQYTADNALLFSAKKEGQIRLKCSCSLTMDMDGITRPFPIYRKQTNCWE
jgi:hemolysin activation/secretion protein